MLKGGNLCLRMKSSVKTKLKEIKERRNAQCKL